MQTLSAKTYNKILALAEIRFVRYAAIQVARTNGDVASCRKIRAKLSRNLKLGKRISRI